MAKRISLIPEHWYKFNDRGEEYIGQYLGTDTDFECCVCGKGHKGHTFNVFYDENGYESWGYGNAHMPTIIEDLGLSDEVIIGE